MSAAVISRSDAAPAPVHRLPEHTAEPNLQVRRAISSSTGAPPAPKAPPEKSHSGKVNIKA